MNMRYTRIVAVALLLILNVGGIVIHAQWIQSNGPRGAFVNSLVSDSMRIFAGTKHGILLSIDNGLSWSIKNTGLTNLDVRSVLIADSLIFAATPAGVFRSTDNAESWTLPTDSLASQNITSLTTDGVHIFAGSRSTSWTNGGVFTSIDNGATWTLLAFEHQRVNFVQMVDTLLFAGITGQMVGSGALYASTDSGTTWSFAGLAGADAYSCIASINGSLFVGTNYGLYTSKGLDSAWTSAGISSGIGSLAAIDSTIFAAGPGVYRSTNRGETWTNVESIVSNLPVTSLTVQGSALFAGTSGGGIFLTTDKGLNWASANNDLRSTYVTSFAFRSTDLFAGTWGGGMFHSTNEGISWLPSNKGFAVGSIVSSLLVGGDTLYSASSYNRGVYRSTDNGATWKNIGLTDNLILTLALTQGTLFAGTEGQGIYVSTDYGATWVQRIFGLGYYFPRCSAVIGDTLYVGTASLTGSGGNGLFRMTVTDTTWTAAGLQAKRILSLAIRHPYIFAGTDGEGVFLSTNGGGTWNPVNTYLGGLRISSLMFVDSLLVAGTEVGVYRTANNGSTWKLIGSDLPQIPINSLIVVGNKLLAGTSYSAVWSVPLSEVTFVLGSTDEIPVKFTLEQNYPNPFNSETTIRFSLADPVFVHLSLYNVLGQEVARVLSKEFLAGIHTVHFDAANLTSGVYFYKIDAGSFSQTRRLVLIR